MAVFNEEEQQRIRKAIEDAEHRSSGEIRVCIEKRCSENVLDRAAKYFQQLNMHKTKLRHGVLVYVATVDRKFAIIGDAGINQVVPPIFGIPPAMICRSILNMAILLKELLQALKLPGNSSKNISLIRTAIKTNFRMI